jgi:hypothetical protein
MRQPLRFVRPDQQSRTVIKAIASRGHSGNAIQATPGMSSEQIGVESAPTAEAFNLKTVKNGEMCSNS